MSSANWRDDEIHKLLTIGENMMHYRIKRRRGKMDRSTKKQERDFPYEAFVGIKNKVSKTKNMLAFFNL